MYIYIFKEIKILPDYRVCPSFRIASRHASSGEIFFKATQELKII